MSDRNNHMVTTHNNDNGLNCPNLGSSNNIPFFEVQNPSQVSVSKTDQSHAFFSFHMGHRPIVAYIVAQIKHLV